MDLKTYFTVLSGFLAILSFFMFPIVTAQGNERFCPHGGVNFRGRCFWFTLVKKTWSDAGHLCHNLYGDHVTLVTIKDRETNEFIRSQTTATVWIGLHEAHGETQWRWVDNTEPANGNYRNWEPGAPEIVNAELQNCAVMYRGADLWRDVGCKKSYKSVCAELPSAPMCPNGGTFFRDRCYWRGTSGLPWAAANQACQDEFGPEARLVVARDAEVNMFLSRLVYPGIWLGLSDKTEEHVWKWIDEVPLEYSNWRAGEPNNVDQEDCAVLHYDDATWNDQPCGDPSPPFDIVTNKNMYICAIPPCYERIGSDGASDSVGSGSSFDDDEDVEVTDDTICVHTECTQYCVAGGACNTTGECICVQQFPGMTCDLALWKVEMENDVINATTGGILTLKCKVNLPVDHIVSLTWSKTGPGIFSEDRTTITNIFTQGYSTLQISDVGLEDAGQYLCQALLSFGSIFNDVMIPAVRSAIVDVTESTTTVPTTKPTTERTTTRGTTTVTPTTRWTTTQGTTIRATTQPRQETTKVTSTQMTSTKTSTDQTTSKEITTPYKTDKNDIPPTKKIKEEKDTDQNQGNEINTNLGDGKQANKEASVKEKENSTNHPGRGSTAAIAILSIMVALLLVALVGLMMKMKRMEGERFGVGRLVELQERF